tara:strand:+ start:113 stop:547 length:435 start_codon:yes stop_codon:yes gene_type:complete
MSKKEFDILKIFNIIIKTFGLVTPDSNGSFYILGSSAEKNKWVSEGPVQDLVDRLKKEGFDTIKQRYEKPHPNHLLFQVFDPHEFEEEIREDIIDKLFKNKEKVILIGCPHDFIKNINFSSKAVIIDPWGIVEDRDDLKIIREL